MKAVVMTLTSLKQHSNPHLQLVIVPVALQSSLCSVKTVTDCFLQTILVTRPHQVSYRLFPCQYTLNSTTALNYETMFCSDHHNDGFVLANFLPGPLFSETPPIGSSKHKKGPRVTYQKVVNWPAFDSHVIEWLRNVNSNDLLHSV